MYNIMYDTTGRIDRYGIFLNELKKSCGRIFERRI